jgi:hypothetical protein
VHELLLQIVDQKTFSFFYSDDFRASVDDDYPFQILSHLVHPFTLITAASIGFID